MTQNQIMEIVKLTGLNRTLIKTILTTYRDVIVDELSNDIENVKFLNLLSVTKNPPKSKKKFTIRELKTLKDIE